MQKRQDRGRDLSKGRGRRDDDDEIKRRGSCVGGHVRLVDLMLVNRRTGGKVEI